MKEQIYSDGWNKYYHIKNDTEPAYIPRPGHECCPEQEEECICVTSGDVDLWNRISAIDESTLSGLQDVSALVDSAEYWNSNYETVSSNSANWEIAYNSISSIYENSANISALSAIIGQNLYFDKMISGDGTSSTPYGVENYNNTLEWIKELTTTYYKLYNKDGEPNWITRDATEDIMGSNPYLKTLFSAIDVKNNNQDTTLNNHQDLITWIIQHMVSKDDFKYHYKFVEIEDEITDPEQLAPYTAENCLYYYGR